MHREISHTDLLGPRKSNTSLYVFSLFVGFLLARDLLPKLQEGFRYFGIETGQSTRFLFDYRYALLAAIVGGARVLFYSLEKLLEGKLVADLAIAIACLAAIAMKEPLVASEVVFIGLLGECLEAYTMQRGQSGIAQLIELFPLRTWVLRNGSEVRILTTELVRGDEVVVKPGGKIPVDGTIMSGSSCIDFSALTGESIPQDKSVGDKVFAGGINQQGQITIRAEAVYQQTVAGKVIDYTVQALQDKTKQERIVDRYARYFLPVVLLIALLTLLGNLFAYMGPFRPASQRLNFVPALYLGLYPTLSVLVVACPCALILATPAAMVAALGRLAGTGILIKGVSVLEKLTQVNAIAFDKTGTLTEGKLALSSILPEPGYQELAILQIMSSIEQSSDHPIAQCFQRERESRQLPLLAMSNYQTVPGQGMSAEYNQEFYWAGSSRWLATQGIILSEEQTQTLNRLHQQSETVIFLGKNKDVIGFFGVKDTIRADAEHTLIELRKSGIEKILILSGDQQNIVEHVAETLAIKEYYGNCLPLEKAEKIKEFSTAAIVNPALASNDTTHRSNPSDDSIAFSIGYPISSTTKGSTPPSYRFAFVGDGINDAPALVAAEVGIAVGSGSDLARHAGSIVLLGSPLSSLPLLFRLSRETMRIIQQNLILFAFGANILGIIITAWLWPLLSPSSLWYEQSPLAAAIYHQFGSLAVLLNSMRLLFFENTKVAKSWQKIQQLFESLQKSTFLPFDLDQFLHTLFDWRKPIMTACAGLALLAYCGTGIVIIQANEIGIVQTLGRWSRDLPPGWHWCWPIGIDQITKLKPETEQIVEIGFRTLPSSNLDQSPLQIDSRVRNQLRVRGLIWASAHGDNIQRLTDEAIMITGDGDLIELLATLRYTIRDPHQYLFQANDIPQIVQQITETVFREQLAGRSFLDLLTTQRLDLQRRAESITQFRCDTIIPGGLGITIKGISIGDLHPPQEVVPAYHEVARAIQLRDQQVNNAKADAIRKVRLAQESSLQMIRTAEAKSHEKIAQAQADRDNFLAWHLYRSELTSEEENRLKALMAKWQQDGFNIQEIQSRRIQERLLMLQTKQNLSESQLMWTMLTSVLKNRDKIIIDADNLPGKRQLFLVDPNSLRPNLLLPPDSLKQAMPERKD